MKSRSEAVAGINSPAIIASVLHELPEHACWPWKGHVTPQGYGGSYVPGTRRKVSAHRVVWELLVGPLLDWQVLDHMCHNPDLCHEANGCPHRACVNPSHLRITTAGDNTLRGDGPTARNAQKTHCKHGHPFDETNTMHRSGGGRACRACGIERARQKTISRGGRSRFGRRTVTDSELRTD